MPVPRSGCAFLAKSLAALLLACAASPLAAQPPELVRDIRPGDDGSNPDWLVDLDGSLIFAANDGTVGQEPWRSDGTPEGTLLLRDVSPGPSGLARNLTVAQAIAYFTGLSPGIWKTDGTERGTVLVSEIRLATSSPEQLTAVGGGVFFTLSTADTGIELWASDGTEEGTRLVKDLLPGSSSSRPTELTAFRGRLVFGALDASSEHRLWVSDGTESGTRPIASVVPAYMASTGEHCYFAGVTAGTGTELWRTDGTPAGTILIRDIFPGGSSIPAHFTAVGDVVFFWAVGDPAQGRELWKTDGTEAGTVLVKDVFPGSSGSVWGFGAPAAVLGGKLLFAANDGVWGPELWISDGTAAGTTLVKDIQPGPDGSFPTQLTVLGGRAYFTARTAVDGVELWTSDGTEAGTLLLADVFPGLPSSLAAELTVAGGRLFFAANDGVHGRELWALDRRGLFADGFESGDTSAWSSSVP